MGAELMDWLAKAGIPLKDTPLLRQALTHSSKLGESNNERLEFLGDRVLNLAVAAALYKTFPAEAEGLLAKRHAGLVQGRTLAEIAGGIGLGVHLNLAESERASGGAENENILSDAMEALLGAVYLEAGYEAAETIVLKLWDKRIESLIDTHTDPKTELQEWVQARGMGLPDYAIIEKTGPDHAPSFLIEVRVEGQKAARAHGTSRRAAEKEAARNMLAQVKGQS